MLEEHNYCSISISQHIPKLRYEPLLPKFILHLHFAKLVKSDCVNKYIVFMDDKTILLLYIT